MDPIARAVRAERMAARLDELSPLGRNPATGGIHRFAYTEPERAAHRLVAAWMAEAGLEVREDAAGNLFGRLPGRRPGPVVLTGSHLDSVPEGGRFDGPAGVLASLEAAQAIGEVVGRPELPLEVVVWVGEEGSRFPGGLLGSGIAVGHLPDLSVRDPYGVRLDEAMRQVGLDPHRLAEARLGQGSVAAYLELHIEQSRRLEQLGQPVGIVTGIAGPVFMRGRLFGRAEHAGATPMADRRDPLPAAGEVVLAVERLAKNYGPTAVGTVGRLTTRPGAHNVIPAEVEMTFDVRDIDRENRDRLVAAIVAEAQAAAAQRGLRLELETLADTAPTPVPASILACLRRAAQATGLDAPEIPSGAAHDAMHLAEIAPSGMIFVRSRDGLSHNPAEFTSLDDWAAGCRLLALALADLASGRSADA